MVALVLALLLCYGVAALGGVATAAGLRGWYQGLSKPSWTPPNWLFGPVWTILYGMMAVAVWLVWREDHSLRNEGLIAFGVQLGLNLLWSFLFFGWRKLGAASVEVVSLWVMILVSTVLFFRIHPLAGALMVPYLAWVTFASALNIAVWNLNRHAA